VGKRVRGLCGVKNNPGVDSYAGFMVWECGAGVVWLGDCLFDVLSF
jgi:hypothetical protein